MKSKTPIFLPGEILDRLLAGEPLEIILEAQCRAPVVAWISVKKPADREYEEDEDHVSNN